MARPLVLDSTAPSSDENARLRPEPSVALPKDRPRLEVLLEPYGVRFWSIESK